MSSFKRGLTVGVLAAVGVCSAAMAGPDVVVSTIGNTFSKYGAKNVGTTANPVLVTGYAVTTVSCNIGNAEAEWFQFTADHPVIGTQLYRLHNGRFEQIGLNWLKHGFCAADAPSCTNLGPPGSAYLANGSCDWLGKFATDTYGAGLNADQVDCGPRSEVNAATGAYPYPYNLGRNQVGDCVYKRLQVFNEDLNPATYAGARYFTEVHYVTTDEATADRTNNASYRETLVGALNTSNSTPPTGTTCPGNAGYVLSFTGSTIPLKPAIEAWKTIDPTVTLSYVDVPGDGRIIVGAKVTDLGGGLWQYEYAVYNHNSHRSVGKVTLAKSNSPGATFTNLGFHDVAYHSGEPFDGTDWTGQVKTTSVEWATTDFAANANANAIRWSTLYNFRFQSNQAPTTGAVTLGLFRPGTPETIDATGLPVPSVPPACAADFNGMGGLSVQDVFDFLAAYFAGLPAADFNGVGGISVEDIFDYLAAYFTGCP